MLYWQLERHRSLDGDEPERVQSGSSSGDERVIGRGHQSRADSTPRRRRVLPDVDVATADTIPVKPGKFDKRYINCKLQLPAAFCIRQMNRVNGRTGRKPEF